MKKATRAKLEKMACHICNRHLGRKPREQYIDSLNIFAALLPSENRREEMYEQFSREFKEWVENHIEKIYLPPHIMPGGWLNYDSIDERADEQETFRLWAKVGPICKLAWREVSERIELGQNVAGKLTALTDDLVEELTVGCA